MTVTRSATLLASAVLCALLAFAREQALLGGLRPTVVEQIFDLPYGLSEFTSVVHHYFLGSGPERHALVLPLQL
jgi:hypothetical protein